MAWRRRRNADRKEKRKKDEEDVEENRERKEGLRVGDKSREEERGRNRQRQRQNPEMERKGSKRHKETKRKREKQRVGRGKKVSAARFELLPRNRFRGGPSFPAAAQHLLQALKQERSPSPSIDCIGSQGQRDFGSHRDSKLLPKNYCWKTSELRLFLSQPVRGQAAP